MLQNKSYEHLRIALSALLQDFEEVRKKAVDAHLLAHGFEKNVQQKTGKFLEEIDLVMRDVLKLEQEMREI